MTLWTQRKPNYSNEPDNFSCLQKYLSAIHEKNQSRSLTRNHAKKQKDKAL